MAAERVSRKWFVGRTRTCCSMDEKTRKKVFKEVGLFSLKKKIEEVVLRAEMIALPALEMEEATRIQQEQLLRHHNLWESDDSNQTLNDFDNAVKLVNSLKDLTYKVEDAKLITQLAELDFINNQLFKEAYDASLDIGKFLDRYEMSKLLVDPYERDGACVIIRAGPEEGHTDTSASQLFAEKLLNMYLRWAQKQGCFGRVTEKCSSKEGGIKFATVEFETKLFYGYLSGEEGAHRLIHTSLDGSVVRQACSAGVEVIPIFLESTADIQIDEEDLEITSCLPNDDNEHCDKVGLAVQIHHKPTGITVQCSGERSHFANTTKATNRLKARLLVVAKNQGVPHINQINKGSIVDVLKHETRRYAYRPRKLVQDMKTGCQVPHFKSVLDGNIEPFIKAHISHRKGRDL